MKVLVISIFILVCLAGIGSPTTELGFGPFSWPWEAFFEMMETLMNDMTQVILGSIQATDELMEEGMSSISYTILELSNDILAMADKIGDMSLQIGIMADRIVQTEVLLADVLLILTGHENSTIPIPPVGNYTWGPGTPVILLEPKDGNVVMLDEMPNIKLNVPIGEQAVVFYASSDPAFPDGHTTSVLATNTTQLVSWNRVIESQASKGFMYLAVRLVDMNTGAVSGVSNSVLLHL